MPEFAPPPGTDAPTASPPTASSPTPPSDPGPNTLGSFFAGAILGPFGVAIVAIRTLRPEVSAEHADACMGWAYTGLTVTAFVVAMYLATPG